MSDSQISLYFQLREGEKADLEIVSAAAIAWVESLRAVARAYDPNSDVKVELVDADESSLIYNTLIDWFERNIEKRIERLDRGGGRLPRTRKLALALALFLIVTGYPTYDFYFGDEGFTDEDRQLMQEILEHAKKDSAVETSKRKFFRTLEREPAITAVGIKEHPKAEPLVTVQSDRFAEASGLWVTDDSDVPEQVTHPVLEVVLVKPALVHTPRAWTFKPEGLPEFEAVMRDPLVLQAIQENGLPERLREGIPMTIRLEVREVLVDGQWKLVRGGRSVIRVISPKLD
ncbi:MAG TPA: hypothetical protein VN034_05950 [Sphingopyxis sp.]|nr:hypothetical protein [Sphingopyxis sp.]